MGYHFSQCGHKFIFLFQQGCQKLGLCFGLRSALHGCLPHSASAEQGEGTELPWPLVTLRGRVLAQVGSDVNTFIFLSLQWNFSSLSQKRPHLCFKEIIYSQETIHLAFGLDFSLLLRPASILGDFMASP